jgi:DNA-binding LacI/PurR family transcriptional regulator
VVDHPPHLWNYGLVFLRRAEAEGGWARFCDNLITASRQLMQNSPRRIVVYQGISGHEDVEDFQRMAADLRLHRLAGLVLYSPNVHEVLSSASLPQVPGQGRVTIGPEVSDTPTVWIDFASFFDQAVKHLVERGRRRIAMISYQGFARQYAPLFETTLARYGATTRPYWIQEPYEYYQIGITRCLHLLMHERQTERPDGLIVADDHMLEAASRGLFNAGVRVPEEAEIVAFANLPFLAPSVVPVHHLGFEVENLLSRCLDTIDRQVRGEPTESISLVPVRFSNEFGSPQQ